MNSLPATLKIKEIPSVSGLNARFAVISSENDCPRRTTKHGFSFLFINSYSDVWCSSPFCFRHKSTSFIVKISGASCNTVPSTVSATENNKKSLLSIEFLFFYYKNYFENSYRDC